MRVQNIELSKVICPVCNGLGFISNEPCDRCEGAGETETHLCTSCGERNKTVPVFPQKIFLCGADSIPHTGSAPHLRKRLKKQ